ncbi:MAG TPA: hypothetical protein P5525_23450, partial [Candidatus Paceibacterota bacterium]|nr:hypothetical protein [Candidatus Paceibacterota bacterium]
MREWIGVLGGRSVGALGVGHWGGGRWLWWLGLLTSVWGAEVLAQVPPCQPLIQGESGVQSKVVHAGCEDHNWVYMYVGNPSSCHLNEDWDID